MFARIIALTAGMAALAVTAYALTPQPDRSGMAVSAPTNITVIEKTSAWPVKGAISMQPCRLTRCLDA